MTVVLLASSSPQLQERVAAAADGAYHPVEGPLPSDAAALMDHVEAGVEPDVVLLDVDSDSAARAIRLAARIDQRNPASSVLLVGDLDAEDGLAAMRAGVRDIINPESSVEDIRRALARARGLAQGRATALTATGRTAQGPRGRVIAVVSPKGGVGKTTVATNLAVGLARSAPRSVVLVDLDIQFGDVATGLDLEPAHGLPEAIRGRATEDSMVLKTYLVEHETGLYVLCGPKLPTDADDITGDQVRKLVDLLAAEFRYVILDTAPGLSDHTLAGLDLATDLVLVTIQDPVVVQGLRAELDTLDDLQITTANRQVVLNLTERRSPMTLAEVEDTLRMRVDLVLPRHRSVPASVNQGVPLLQRKPDDPVAKGLTQLVERYTPPKPTTMKTGRRSGRHAVKR